MMSHSRKHPRVEYISEVTLVSNGDTATGRTEDISQGGVLVITELSPAFGTRLKLVISLPGIRDICEIPCIVRWVKAGSGLGLQFEQLRPIEVWSINKLMRSGDGQAT